MKFFRKLLFPFSLLYILVTSIRNWFYDIGIFKSYSFDIPIIAVGNLSTGGTGKTPQIEYLIRLLSKNHKTAVLSRGYKRKSTGFVLANEFATVETLGDEPFQYYKKFKNIQVAVDSNRVNGINQLLNLSDKPQVILLDDAFQHRRIRAEYYILLTTFNDLYCDDYVLPVGNLRECIKGANRAKFIVVTKSPKNLGVEKQNEIEKKLKLNTNQKLFFSTINYDKIAFSKKSSILTTELLELPKLIIAGIAKPETFIKFVKNSDDEVLIFPDHHDFSVADILEMQKKSKDKIIVTTEKDFVRLDEKLFNGNLFYLGIQIKFLKNKDDFDDLILNFLKK
ncbi:MAG: tetraacyldisaccharide 4-kinase [Bacteroidota bacterium]